MPLYTEPDAILKRRYRHWHMLPTNNTLNWLRPILAHLG